MIASYLTVDFAVSPAFLVSLFVIIEENIQGFR